MISFVHAAPVNIMPLGDSITYDEKNTDREEPRSSSIRTGYRSHLYYKLSDVNYTVDFVGSRIAGESIEPTFDPDNEGHPGWTSFDIAEHAHEYLTKNHADIVLLHIGTNDHSSFTGGVDSILQQIDLYEQQSGRPVRVIVALIIDRQGQTDLTIQAFNKKLKELVTWRALAGDSLTLVDMYRGAGLTRADYADNTHPNDIGYQKMATVWFNALMAPYTPTLYTFPSTVVDRTYVEAMIRNLTTRWVTCTAEVPDTGIIF